MVKPERVIILGSSGFIGKYLFEKFSSARQMGAIGFSSKDLDLLSIRSLKYELSGLALNDVLVLAAAITRLKENTFYSMLKNMQIVENVANLIAERPVGQVVYMSTIDVYGIDIKKGRKITEQTLLSPNDYYAVSKLAGEFLLKKTCSDRKIPLVILRLAGVYGPGDENKSTIDKIVTDALRNKKITIYGDGKNLRDYVYVDDLYKVVKYAISRRLSLTVNIATGKSYSISEIAHTVRSLLPLKADIEYRNNSFKGSGKRIRDLIFDCSYLRKSFPGLKFSDLKGGLKAYLENKL